ncbi:hypothetical protein GCM10023339_04390 [Alloalcanivorax gelatiniphagus]
MQPAILDNGGTPPSVEPRERPPHRMDHENRPVLTGLIALVGVAVAIGLLGGLAVLVGVKATGIGGTSSASADSSSPATFSLPRPSDTSTETPQTDPVQPDPGAETSSEAAAEGISLTAAQQSVSPMQQINLTGTYQGGEGAILQVQRRENGTWADFPVTMSVSGGTFSTYVLTARTGPNEFRVVDTDSDVISNAVTVTVG